MHDERDVNGAFPLRNDLRRGNTRWVELPARCSSFIIPHSSFIVRALQSFGLMAWTGHSSTQAPQSVHVSGSIMYFGSPSLIASTGQTGRQVPHMVHSLEIT
jgi:hypothetical protein